MTDAVFRVPEEAVEAFEEACAEDNRCTNDAELCFRPRGHADDCGVQFGKREWTRYALAQSSLVIAAAALRWAADLYVQTIRDAVNAQTPVNIGQSWDGVTEVAAAERVADWLRKRADEVAS